MYLTNDNIEYLIIGFLENRLSEEELHTFFEWVNSNPENRQYFLSLKAINNHRKKNDIPIEESWGRLSTKIVIRKKMRSKRLIRVVLASAACIAVLLSLGLFYKYSIRQLQMESESQMYVCHSESSIVTIGMPDGTIVKIGPHSVLSYGVGYGKKDRVVNLDGEAYFDVKESLEKPFSVISGDQKISVTGTKFNVRSYSGDKEFVTTLLEGSIIFHSSKMGKKIDLRPHEQIRYNNTSKTIAVEKLDDANNEIAWLDNRYVFKFASLQDILDRMKNIYNVRFVCPDKKALETTFKVTFYQGESLDDFMKIIKKMTGLSSTLKGDTIYLE